MEDPFGDPVAKWNDRSPGKLRRLGTLCASLELHVGDVDGLRYQLLHRTASAIYEAQRYGTAQALMPEHSFSTVDTSFRDFTVVAEAMALPVQTLNRISEQRACESVRLRPAWDKDSASG